MTNHNPEPRLRHRSSIPMETGFTPPPPITLGPAARGGQRNAESAGVAPSSAHPDPQPASSAAAPKISLRKRIAALVAFIAVPAMAAPGDFGAMAGDAPDDAASPAERAALDAAMAFERPGMSFPGSAFYYLADPPEQALVALPESDPFETGAVGARDLGALIDVGPAARAFFAGSGVHRARAQDCLAQAIWYEAASESEAGQRAVAQVVLNRVAHPSWPSSVCGVVYEGSARSSGCQFTFTCDGSLVRRAPGTLRGASWERAQTIAAQALNGSVYAPIGHATHYHTLWVDPYWAKTLDPVGVVGAHRFYRNRGRAGDKSAFTARYAGVEPGVSPGQTARAGDPAGASAPAPSIAASSIAATSTRIAPRPTLETAPQAAAAAPMAVSAPVTAEGETRASGAVGQARREYARAGQWKVDPATLDLGKPERKSVAEKPGNATPAPQEP